MANGDIINARIGVEGFDIFLTFEGWASKAGAISYNFGDTDNSVGSASLAVVSEGYSNGVLGTVARTLFLTAAIRQPYPNDAALDEVVVGSDLEVRFALDETVYDDDRDGGAGTSGVDPLISVSAGFATDGVDSSNSVTDLAVTNNSALDYPKVIGQWDWDNLRGGWRRMENDFNVGFRARHGHGVDHVTLSAIGATSAVNTTSNVTALSATQAVGSGLYHESYLMRVTIAGYAQGEQIDLRAIAYPRIGDADSILDTNDTTATAERIRGLTTCYVMCDKEGGLKIFGIVDADSGDDTTGATSADEAASRANPFLTIGAALNAGATVVYVKNTAAIPDILGTNGGNVINPYFYEVTEDPDDTGAVVNRSGSNQNYNFAFLCYTKIGISYSSGNGWLDGRNQPRQLLFDQCAFHNTATPTVGLGYRSEGCNFLNCTGMGGDDYAEFGTNRLAYSFTGNLSEQNFTTNCWYTSIANRATTKYRLNQKTASNPAPDQRNIFAENCGLYGYDIDGGSDGFIRLASNAPTYDAAIIGNILEVSNVTSSGPALWLGGDGSTHEMDNVIVVHNTVAGERCNMFYNDSGNEAVHRRNIFVFGNAFQSYNIKSDTFASSPNGARVGNWAQMYGVNYHDNIYDTSASSSFVGEYLGARTSFEIGGIGTVGELGYVNEASSAASGLGNGDYTPDAGSILLNRTITPELVGFDQLGTAANDQIGAVFVPAVAPPEPEPSRRKKKIYFRRNGVIGFYVKRRSA